MLVGCYGIFHVGVLVARETGPGCSWVKLLNDDGDLLEIVRVVKVAYAQVTATDEDNDRTHQRNDTLHIICKYYIYFYIIFFLGIKG